jgi:hypothetical protein
MTFDMYLPHTVSQQDTQDAASTSSTTATSTSSAPTASSSRPSSFRRTSFSSSAAASAAAAAASQHTNAHNTVSLDVDTLHSPGIHILKVLVVEKCQEGCNPIKK